MYSLLKGGSEIFMPAVLHLCLFVFNLESKLLLFGKGTETSKSKGGR